MSKTQPNLSEEHIITWQKKAFPWMVGVIVFLSIFFISATAFQLLRIQDQIDYSDVANDSRTALEVPQELSELQLKKELETYVIDRRYHQGNMLLTSRIWIQYLGFLVGTILVLIGAIFILGKMQEPASNLDSDLKNLGKLSFNSSSPGLFLALFGTIIITSTLFYHPEITTTDASLYMDKNYQFDAKGMKSTNDKTKDVANDKLDESKSEGKKGKQPKINK